MSFFKVQLSFKYFQVTFILLGKLKMFPYAWVHLLFTVIADVLCECLYIQWLNIVQKYIGMVWCDLIVS